MYRKDIRISWDKGLKDLNLIKQKSTSPNAYIYHTWCKSPIVLISERDFVEKRVEFLEEKYAVIIGLSVPENYYPEVKKVIRCNNYINIQEIEEKTDYWLFTTYSQTDLKMPIPDSFLNFTLPMKFNSWYEDYLKFFNKKYKDIEKEMEKLMKQKEKERKKKEKEKEKEEKKKK